MVALIASLQERTLRSVGTCVSEHHLQSLEPCREGLRLLHLTKHLPYFRAVATAALEEFEVRAQNANVILHAAGTPDAGALRGAWSTYSDTADRLRKGTGQLSFELLGEPVGALDPGHMMMRTGALQELVQRARQFEAWDVRLAALRAAILTEGEEEVRGLGAYFASWDPREDELRSGLGAALCLRGEPARGLEFLRTIQNDRAERRYAAMSRDWGDIRLMILACATKANLTIPEAPFDATAGVNNAEVAQSAFLASRGKRLSPDTIAGLFTEASSADDAQALAAVLGVSVPVERAASAEPPCPSPGSLTTAANQKRSVAAVARTDPHQWSTYLRTSSPTERRCLAAVIGRVAIDTGSAEDGLAFVLEVEKSESDRAFTALLRARILRSMLRHDEATVALATAIDSPEANSVYRFPATVELAELLLIAADLPRARSLFERADNALPNDLPDLLPAYAWTTVASGAQTRCSPDAELRWVGFPSFPSEQWSDVAICSNARWWYSSATPPVDQKQRRLEWLGFRGDAPPNLLLHLMAATNLADGVDVETWLDTALGIDRDRFTLRGMALSRLEAAMARGDRRSQELWTKRYRSLLRWRDSATAAPMADHLGI